jgi:hypothetical protein
MTWLDVSVVVAAGLIVALWNAIDNRLEFSVTWFRGRICWRYVTKELHGPWCFSRRSAFYEWAKGRIKQRKHRS